MCVFTFQVLLGSDLIKSSSEERSLLKILGSWLGKSTIGRNQVLRGREIDPKSLIIEAYEKGFMIAVIPFTSKILELCQSSQAYQPPNPLTMGILGLLAEIYAMPNLKMNLKFDIEVLFKNLGVNPKDVTPTSLLKDRMVGEVKSGTISTLNQVELLLEVASASHAGGHSHILSQVCISSVYPNWRLSISSVSVCDVQNLVVDLACCSGTLTEDEKLAALGLSDHLPSAQGLLTTAIIIFCLSALFQSFFTSITFNSFNGMPRKCYFRTFVDHRRSIGKIPDYFEEEHDKKYDVNKQMLKTAFGHGGHWSTVFSTGLMGIIVEFPGIILRCISRDEAALVVAQKGLYENASNSAHVTAHLSILAAIHDVSKLLVKELTSWVCSYEFDLVPWISPWIRFAAYNLSWVALEAATEFAISLIQTLLINDSRVIYEFHNLVVIDALAKLAARPGSLESLKQLVEVARNPAAFSAVSVVKEG
ncbi:transcription regulator [Actinidia rufa]|uniref:Transcription regulator n=1 Tax=Actinidia rufa TaxID=165716 RepID=A0A7J0FNV6_9ERIC|nr:transcription regulator [Actinidia rufa]